MSLPICLSAGGHTCASSIWLNSESTSVFRDRSSHVKFSKEKKPVPRSLWRVREVCPQAMEGNEAKLGIEFGGVNTK